MPEIQKVATHHWLKSRNQVVFHAYLSSRIGEKSVCGESPAIGVLRDMDIPGDRSPCCLKCMSGLYGFELRLGPEEK